MRWTDAPPSLEETRVAILQHAHISDLLARSWGDGLDLMKSLRSVAPSSASSVVGTCITTMTKADLIQHLADKKKMTWQHAELLVNTVFACMEQSMRRGERIEIRGFRKFPACLAGRPRSCFILLAWRAQVAEQGLTLPVPPGPSA
jgi:hypothetical protein